MVARCAPADRFYPLIDTFFAQQEQWATSRDYRAALEKLVADKRLVLADELAARKDEWDRAARATPHGKPIELPGR